MKKYKRGGYFDRKNCDDTVHEIVNCDMHTHLGGKRETEKVIQETEKHIVWHEVIHAFLSELGLEASSTVITIVGPKMKRWLTGLPFSLLKSFRHFKCWTFYKG